VSHPFALFAKGRAPGTLPGTRGNLLLKILEHMRRAYDYTVVGNVVMPKHMQRVRQSAGTLARILLKIGI
jgi:hypothetical protein